jgi:hypothetical protein
MNLRLHASRSLLVSLVVFTLAAGALVVASRADARFSGNPTGAGVTTEKVQRTAARNFGVRVKLRSGQRPLTAWLNGSVKVGRISSNRLGFEPLRVRLGAEKNRLVHLRLWCPAVRRWAAHAMDDGRRVTATVAVKLTDGQGTARRDRLKVRLIPRQDLRLSVKSLSVSHGAPDRVAGRPSGSR